MRIVLNSDTHGLHDGVPQLPQGDILVHAGDFVNAGYDLREVVSFNRWLGEQPFAHRIVCGGNHDRLFENSPELERPLPSNGTYLEDSGTTIAGFSFWDRLILPRSSTGLLCILAVKRQMCTGIGFQMLSMYALRMVLLMES